MYLEILVDHSLCGTTRHPRGPDVVSIDDRGRLNRIPISEGHLATFVIHSTTKKPGSVDIGPPVKVTELPMDLCLALLKNFFSIIAQCHSAIGIRRHLEIVLIVPTLTVPIPEPTPANSPHCVRPIRNKPASRRYAV